MYFYENAAREKLRDIQQEAERWRLVSKGREPRAPRPSRWWQKFHLVRRSKSSPPMVARGTDQAG